MNFNTILFENKEELQQTTAAIVKDINAMVWKDSRKGGLFGVIDKVVGVYPYNKSGKIYWGILMQLNTTSTTFEGKDAGAALINKYKVQYPLHNFKLEVNENAIKILVDEIQ